MAKESTNIPDGIQELKKINLKRITQTEAKHDALAMLHMIATAAWEYQIPVYLRIMACKIIIEDVAFMESEETGQDNKNKRFSVVG